jgi:hypothetical protein
MDKNMTRHHELYSARDIQAGPSNRNFGYTVGAVLCLIGLYRWWFHAASAVSTPLIASVGLILIASAFATPNLLAPFNRAWTKLGLLLARAMNPVVMFVIFAVAIMPFAFVMRLFGRDALRLKLDPAAKTYWITRERVQEAESNMKDQF